MAALVFWAAALLLVHTYFFYPALLVAWDGLSRSMRGLRGAPETAPPAPAATRPFVSLVVAAHNEASCIQQKLENSLALRWPADRFEVLIGSDGSTDGTDELVLACTDKRVRLSAAPRGGKTSVLNRCIPAARGEIILLSDANTMIEPDAVEKLLAHFADPDVGAVCGNLRLYNPSKKDYEESAYWRYESAIKQLEGRHGAVLGANGGLYAIRRTLFSKLPPTTIVDDFVIPMRILDRGYQVTYEPAAVAHEETTEDYGKEFGRRARISAGNFQALRMVAGLLLPTRGFPAFAFWSHKVLRWVAPGLMALAFLANLFLLANPLYVATFFIQAAFYSAALLGKQDALSGAPRKVASIAYYFTTMNVAIAVGFWRFLRSTQSAAWDRTARPA